MTRLVFRTAFVTLVAVAGSLPAHAAQSCRDSDYQGVFGAIAVGNFIFTGGIPPGPTVRVGRVEADGNGNAKIQATLSLNGFILKEDYGGTYSIHPDCTMDVTLLIPFPGVPTPIPFKFFGALADDGREATIILLEPTGADVRIILRKQRREDCTNRDLSGGYLLNMSGSIVSTEGAPFGLFSRVGRATFDGKGAFTAETKVSYNGRGTSESLKGVYAIDSSCQVTIAYRIGPAAPPRSVDEAGARAYSGMLTDDGAGVDVMESAPAGAAIVGTLRQQ